MLIMSTSKSSESDCIMTDENSLAKKLRFALELTCKKYMSSLKFSLLKSSFKEIYKHNPETLKSVYDQLCSQLSATIAAELDELCEQKSIDYLLDSLEMIKKSQDSSQISWRPTGNPDEDLRDHMYHLKLKEKEDLQGVLKELSDANMEFSDEVHRNHAEIMTLKGENEDLHEKFSHIISSFTGSHLGNAYDTLSTSFEESC